MRNEPSCTRSKLLRRGLALALAVAASVSSVAFAREKAPAQDASVDAASADRSVTLASFVPPPFHPRPPIFHPPFRPRPPIFYPPWGPRPPIFYPPWGPRPPIFFPPWGPRPRPFPPPWR